MTDSNYIVRRSALLACVATAMIFLFTQISLAAETPKVTTFTASTPYINSNYTELLSWTVTNSTGSGLYFTCPAGVTIKRSTGSVFPCNTRQSYSTNDSDSASFVVTNVSGVTRDIKVTVYPKNAASVDYDAGAMSTSFSVGTSPQPIIDFSFSSTTVASGVPVTLIWKAVDTPGVNIQFDCAVNIQIFSTSPASNTPLPCGVPAFSPDLPQSGSVIVTPVNTSPRPANVSAHIFPVIAAGSYDGIRSLSADFTVTGKPAHVDPSVTDFKSSQNAIVPGVPFTLSWATKNAAGANIQFSCTDTGGNSVSIEFIVGTTSMPLSCNQSAFSAALPSTGSTTVKIRSSGLRINGGALGILLFPQDSSGTYFAALAQTLNLNILPADSAPPVASVIAPPSQVILTSATAATSTAVLRPQATNQNTRHYTFTKPLQRGSRNADVTALQTYLAKDSSIYPEGSITGFFGPATAQAVGRFQERYVLTNKNDSAYGMVGPKTRAKLNTLQ